MRKSSLAILLAVLLLCVLGYWLSAGRRIFHHEADRPSDLTDSRPPAAPVPPPEKRPPTQAENDLLPPADPEAQAFARECREVLERLPTAEQVRRLPPSEAHFTPAILLQAAAKIGERSAAVEKNPSLNHEGMRFFSACAAKEEAEASLRALCLANLRKHGQRNGLPVEEEGLPEDVRRMADRLKGLL